jgi:hypothetical protein
MNKWEKYKKKIIVNALVRVEELDLSALGYSGIKQIPASAN